MDIVKLKNGNGTYVYPVSHTNAIKVNGEQKTLSTKLTEIANNLDYILDAIEEVNIIGNSDSYSDLDITDESGHVISRFENGHIETLNFDSRDIGKIKLNIGLSLYEEFDEETSYTIGDIVLYNGVIYKFTSNHNAGSWNDSDVELATVINECKFDKLNVVDSNANLSIADENGHSIVTFTEGHVKTQKFDSRNVKIVVNDCDSSDLDVADENGKVVLRLENGHIKTKEFNSENVSGKIIRVLIYGNSWAGDAVSYAGPLLDEILNGGAKVHIGFCYQGASSLQDHYNNAVNNSSYEKFFYYNSDNGWVTESSVSFNDALHLEDWDIILLQQRSDFAGIENTYQPYLDDLIDIISSRANKPVKFGWILARDKYNSQNNYQLVEIWNNAKNIAQSLLNTTLIEFVIPTGTATENARTTSLDDLGIHLTHDGSHLQDGVPCLVEAYCFVLSILNVYGFGNKSINGSKFEPVATIQPNGSVIGGTAADIVLAQKCAIFAFKNPFVITQVNN